MPSIGSIIQVNSASSFSLPNSSPINPWSGNDFLIVETIISSAPYKMTQADVAKKVGTKQSAIARLESGNINPSLEFLQRVAQVMGLSVHLSRGA